MILKRLNLIKFSSIFGSMNIKNYDNLIKCFNTNFTILFENENLIFTKNNPKFAIENESHGYRTINKIFDNVNDYHDATIPHHDLSNNIDKQHFIRGINRLDYIKENNIPILFVNISMEFDNTIICQPLIDSIINCGFTNMKVLSIYKMYTDELDNEIDSEVDSEIEYRIDNEPILIHISDNHIIYKIHSYGYNDIRDDKVIENILLKHFTFDNLIDIKKNEIINLIE